MSLGLIFGTANFALAQEREITVEVNPVHEVADHLIGVMDTSAQAALNSNFVSVQMTTCEVLLTSSLEEVDQNSVYLYQEQALSNTLDQPYRQRFLHIVQGRTNQEIESRTYKPDNPTDWTGFCQQAQRTIAPDDLGDQVCTVSLRSSSLGYVGSTSDEGCPVNVRGAVRLTNIVVLHADGMDTWDRGFDENDLQVWGAQAEPYRYRWIQ